MSRHLNHVLFLVGRATEDFSLASTLQSGISTTVWVYERQIDRRVDGLEVVQTLSHVHSSNKSRIPCDGVQPSVSLLNAPSRSVTPWPYQLILLISYDNQRRHIGSCSWIRLGITMVDTSVG